MHGVVWRRLDLQFRRLVHQHHGVAAPPSELGSDVIDHPPRGHLDQPAARVVGHALLRPLQRGGQQRFLHRVLCGGEVAEPPDHCAEHLRRQVAQQVLAREVAGRCGHMSTGGTLITCRTSIGMFSGTPPLPGAADARAAIS